MMVTTRSGYCCADAGDAQARAASKTASTPRTRRIGHLFPFERRRSLRLRYHGQQEIRRLPGAEVERVAAGENIGGGVGPGGMRGRGGGPHWVRGLWGARGRGGIFVVAPPPRGGAGGARGRARRTPPDLP